MKLPKSLQCFLLIIILLNFVIPATLEAKTYTLAQTDMHIEIDDAEWYVFTRDNIKDNKELEELGVSYDYMYNLMHKNYIYMDAILYFKDDDDYIELFVRKKKTDEINQLSNFDDKEVLELAEQLAKKQGAKNYKVYQTSYKYAKLEYQSEGLYLQEYYTIVNKEAYTITAQKKESFSSEDAARIQKIVDHIKFDVNPSLTDKKVTKDNGNQTLLYTVIGAVSGSLAVALMNFFKKKKK